MIGVDNNFRKYRRALAGRRIPPLTLDNKWYQLFKQADVTDKVKTYEEEVNELLKEQAKLTMEYKNLKKVKGTLMDGILNAMDKINEDEDDFASRVRTEQKRLLEEVNEKMEEKEERLSELPKEIDEANVELMLITMNIFYERFVNNMEEIKEIDQWVNEVRAELKKNLIIKQDKETESVELYSYMHDIFGPKILEIFDLRYDFKGKKEELMARKTAQREEEQKRRKRS